MWKKVTRKTPSCPVCGERVKLGATKFSTNGNWDFVECLKCGAELEVDPDTIEQYGNSPEIFYYIFLTLGPPIIIGWNIIPICELLNIEIPSPFILLVMLFLSLFILFVLLGNFCDSVLKLRKRN